MVLDLEVVLHVRIGRCFLFLAFLGEIRRDFDFSFGFSAAKRLRFDLKERQWPSEMENGERGPLKTFVH